MIYFVLNYVSIIVPLNQHVTDYRTIQILYFTGHYVGPHKNVVGSAYRCNETWAISPLIPDLAPSNSGVAPPVESL